MISRPKGGLFFAQEVLLMPMPRIRLHRGVPRSTLRMLHAPVLHVFLFVVTRVRQITILNIDILLSLAGSQCALFIKKGFVETESQAISGVVAPATSFVGMQEQTIRIG